MNTDHDEIMRKKVSEAVQRSPDLVSPDVATWVLHWKTRGRLGIDPGAFMYSLLETIRLADLENTDKLRRGFAEYVEAVNTSTDELVRISERR